MSATSQPPRIRAKRAMHGLTHTPEYVVWAAMINRCYCPTARSYRWYGARGITVSDDWLAFENFLRDMGPRPSAMHSIERVDVDGPYRRENCRWATDEEQGNNRRNNLFVEANGERLTASQWARRSGINKSTILYRLASGWNPARAVTEPTRRWVRRAAA